VTSPTSGEDALKDLDEDGIIRIGRRGAARGHSGRQGRAQGQGELTAEERLIIAIFGKKAEETRDVSLRVPHGEKGKIVDVKVFSRFKFRCETASTSTTSASARTPTDCDLCGGDWSGCPATSCRRASTSSFACTSPKSARSWRATRWPDATATRVSSRKSARRGHAVFAGRHGRSILC
jgi:DNA-directed RNA polymerase beta subunit